MSSNAYLYVPQDDGSYLCARIRWSGYLKGVGPYLLKFYSEIEAARALVARGWIQSIEADPAKVVAETMDGEWPQTVAADKVSDEMRWCGADNYLFRDGVWWHFDATAIDGETEPLPVTRERLIAAGIGEAWLDDPTPPLTVDETLRNMLVAAALTNGSDRVRYFSRDGNYGVVCE